MSLPYFQTSLAQLNLLQTKWRSELNPLLAIPLLNGNLLTGINLVVGDNVINTGLGRMQRGWIKTDQNSDSNIYRSAAFNDVTLTLNSSAECVVSLWVF